MTESGTVTDIRLALPLEDRKRIAFGIREEGNVLARDIRTHFHSLRGQIPLAAEGYLSGKDNHHVAGQLRWLADRLDELEAMGEEFRALTHDVPWRELLTFRGKPLTRDRGRD